MRKILKIILFSLLGLIVAAYIFLFFSFNGYKPSAIEYEVVPAALDYFHTTYEDCRSAFIEKANLLVSQYEGVDNLLILCWRGWGRKIFGDGGICNE